MNIYYSQQASSYITIPSITYGNIRKGLPVVVVETEPGVVQLQFELVAATHLADVLTGVHRLHAPKFRLVYSTVARPDARVRMIAQWLGMVTTPTREVGLFNPNCRV